MAGREPFSKAHLRETAQRLGLEHGRGNRYKGQIDGLRVRVERIRRGGGEGTPAREFPRITVWLLRPPRGGLRSHRWGSALARRRSHRKMVLLDDGVDLAVIRTGSPEDLDRLEADGGVERLTSLYRRFPNLSIGATRLKVRLDDFDDLVSMVQDLAKAAHELSG